MANAKDVNDQFEQLLNDLTEAGVAGTKTEADRVRERVLAELDKLGGQSVQDDTLTFEGTKFILPKSYEGPQGIDRAKKYLDDWRRNMEETFEFSRTFNYRPYDGAAALDRAFKRMFGTSGFGKATRSFFGTNPPQMVDIEIAPGKTTQVPWGQIEMPALEATFNTGAERSRDSGGFLFSLYVMAPKRNRRRVEAFFEVVQDELSQRSIYKGKAVAAKDELSLAFVDLSTVDRDKVIYSDENFRQLEANLWTPLRFSDTMRKLGSPLKRAVLLEGPWGTGKTLSGVLTGQVATENGWTFVLARPGQDKLEDTMRTARLYAPAVVWFEDIDVATSGDPAYVAKLLDTLDGVSAKGREVIVGFTSNHVERIAKGVMRPGRIDAVIHFGHLQREQVEPLVRSVLAPELIDPSINWDEVADALAVENSVAAFARETVDRALRFSVADNKGKPKALTTTNLVDAAHGLQRQLELMNDATEGVHDANKLDTVIKNIVTERFEDVINRTVEADEDFRLKVESN